MFTVEQTDQNGNKKSFAGLQQFKSRDEAERLATRLTMQAPKGVTYAVVEVTNLEFG